MSEKTRYSDEELEEFRKIILEKLNKAQKDYDELRQSMMNKDGNNSANTLCREETGQLAQRQLKFIQSLKAALVRIENKTYGICRETGKLIPAERLRAVPHATLSIEAKNNKKH